MPPKADTDKGKTRVDEANSPEKAESGSPPAKRLWPDSATILDRSKGVFFAQWEELLRLRRLVLRSFKLDDIHDLRTASRRFRAALELFYPLVPKGSKTELRKSVRSLTRILGGLRNIDEAQLFFASRTTTDVPVQKQLCNALSKLRADELKRIKRALKSFDHRHLDRIVREMVAGLNDVAILKRNSISLVAYFSEVSIRLFMPIHQLLAGSTVAEHRQLRHSLRIAVKKWRYFFEIIATIMERDYAHFLELLKEYQTVLGRMNDIAEFGLLLRNMKLPTDERDCATAALLAEEESLLKNFTELTERKPLGYTFLI